MPDAASRNVRGIASMESAIMCGQVRDVEVVEGRKNLGLRFAMQLSLE
jgi:hypothetical protein